MRRLFSPEGISIEDFSVGASPLISLKGFDDQILDEKEKDRDLPRRNSERLAGKAWNSC